jgi:hypothetical protein
MGCLCKQIFNVRLYHALAELVNTLTSNSTYGFISTEFEHPPITRTKVAIILQTCPLGHSIHRVHTNLQCHTPYILFFALLSALCTFCLRSVDNQSITQCRQISIMPTLLSARATPVRRFQGVHLSVSGGRFLSFGRADFYSVRPKIRSPYAVTPHWFDRCTHQGNQRNMHVQTTRELQPYITFHVRSVHTRVQVILAVVYTNETHDFQRSADRKCRVQTNVHRIN